MADAHAIGALHLASWQTAYRGLLADSYLDSLDAAERIEWWRARFRLQETTVFVDVNDDRLLGFCAVGPSPDDDADAATWLIANLHVAPDLKRSGIGGTLFDQAVALARDHGARLVTLWVLEGNDAARRFYEKKAMTLDGGRQTREHGPDVRTGEAVVLVRYALDLSKPRATGRG
jgi:GNAT superfamily N-acetyltransferase